MCEQKLKYKIYRLTYDDTVALQIKKMYYDLFTLTLLWALCVENQYYDGKWTIVFA